MKDTEIEKYARLVLEKYNAQKEQQRKNPLTKKENIFAAVVHQVYINLKEDPSFVIDETTFFREVGKQCQILQPKKARKPEETTFKKVKRKIVQTVNQISEELMFVKKNEDDIIDWERSRGVSTEVLEDLGYRVHPTGD